AHPRGDSAFGCRQMLGNVWEWTASDFKPYPGFVVDPYKEYSEPWFSSPHKVLRGGCWATRTRLLRNTWRNFYPPDRRDVLGGFRTCDIRLLPSPRILPLRTRKPEERGFNRLQQRPIPGTRIPTYFMAPLAS